ncbi:MAG: HIT domain-containing protein [Candidatus Nanoarchaeia archaeon]
MKSEEAERIKKQLLENIDMKFPGERGESLKRNINSMDDEQLEKFLKKSDQSECIFCSIASGNVESHKIDETKDAIAVLEINPVSRGHVIVIPKEHIPLEKLSTEISEFAKKVAENLKEKLNPKDIEIAPVNFQGHGTINLIPVYTNESIKSSRYKAQEEELEEVLDILREKPEVVNKVKTKKEKTIKPKKMNSKNIWLPKRIP